jgi:hypothetical protein
MFGVVSPLQFMLDLEFVVELKFMLFGVSYEFVSSSFCHIIKLF